MNPEDGLETQKCANARNHGPHIWSHSPANGSTRRVCPGVSESTVDGAQPVPTTPLGGYCVGCIGAGVIGNASWPNASLGAQIVVCLVAGFLGGCLALLAFRPT